MYLEEELSYSYFEEIMNVLQKINDKKAIKLKKIKLTNCWYAEDFNIIKSLFSKKIGIGTLKKKGMK